MKIHNFVLLKYQVTPFNTYQPLLHQGVLECLWMNDWIIIFKKIILLKPFKFCGWDIPWQKQKHNLRNHLQANFSERLQLFFDQRIENFRLFGGKRVIIMGGFNIELLKCETSYNYAYFYLPFKVVSLMIQLVSVLCLFPYR